jgi:hypothetical protein
MLHLGGDVVLTCRQWIMMAQDCPSHPNDGKAWPLFGSSFFKCIAGEGGNEEGVSV